MWGEGRGGGNIRKFSYIEGWLNFVEIILSCLSSLSCNDLKWESYILRFSRHLKICMVQSPICCLNCSKESCYSPNILMQEGVSEDDCSQFFNFPNCQSRVRGGQRWNCYYRWLVMLLRLIMLAVLTSLVPCYYHLPRSCNQPRMDLSWTPC